MDELYVVARRVLLDALEGLEEHRDAIVLVGAQAIYLRVGDADMAVAPFTTDGDLAIDPSVLTEIPPLEQALMRAQFAPKKPGESVGIWVKHHCTAANPKTEVAIDLLVPASVSPGKKGSRGAGLAGHDSRVARVVKGLEGAIVDADVLRVGALDDTDQRTFDLRVAGPAALVVAKAHKISERQGTDRQKDKDALDVLRLLRGTQTADLAVRYWKLLDDARSREAAVAAIELLRTQFARRAGIGVEMAVRSVGALEDGEIIAASCEALAGDLLAALAR